MQVLQEAFNADAVGDKQQFSILVTSMAHLTNVSNESN
jgi:hypothetical protein